MIERTIKIILYLLDLPALLFVGHEDNSPDLTSSDVQISHQSNTPNWVKLPVTLGQGYGVETEYFTEKLITGVIDKATTINTPYFGRYAFLHTPHLGRYAFLR